MVSTVILIDDDRDDLEIMKEALQLYDKSLAPISFIYPEEAIRVIANDLILVPNYIFIDINMPGITGDKCLVELRKHPVLNNSVITMFSTSMPKDVADSLRKAGADFTFEKPNKFDDYQNILRTIISAS